MNTISSKIFAFSLMGLATIANSNELIVNGSFEDPIATPPWQNFQAGSTGILGWRVTQNTASVLTANCCLPAAPYSGSQYLDLTGPNDGQRQFGAIAQDVDTVPGLVYTLSFQQGNYFLNSSNFDAGTSGLEVAIGGQSYSFSLPSVVSGAIWVKHQVEFTATVATTTISFEGAAGQRWIGLDAVSVTVVPEPATYSLTMLGILAIVWRLGRQWGNIGSRSL